eukprot:4696464-Pyramimonas_sp.AAC.1
MSGQTRYPSRNLGAEFSRVFLGSAEVEQPLATHRVARGEQIILAGRLDRIYINAYTAKLLDCAWLDTVVGNSLNKVISGPKAKAQGCPRPKGLASRLYVVV